MSDFWDTVKLAYPELYEALDELCKRQARAADRPFVAPPSKLAVMGRRAGMSARRLAAACIDEATLAERVHPYDPLAPRARPMTLEEARHVYGGFSAWSDDDGATWHMGEPPAPTGPRNVEMVCTGVDHASGTVTYRGVKRCSLVWPVQACERGE